MDCRMKHLGCVLSSCLVWRKHFKVTTAHCATDYARMMELGVWTDQLETFLWEWMWFIGGLTDPFRLLVLGEWHCHCKETSFLPPQCSSSTVGALIHEQDSHVGVSHVSHRYHCPALPTQSCTNVRAFTLELFGRAAALPLLNSRLRATGW